MKVQCTLQPGRSRAEPHTELSVPYFLISAQAEPNIRTRSRGAIRRIQRAEPSSRTISRIREDVGAPISIDGLMLRIGISIGHATWHCANESVEDALKRADSELYMAKRMSKASQEVL